MIYKGWIISCSFTGTTWKAIAKKDGYQMQCNGHSQAQAIASVKDWIE